jgi:ABC-type transport system substrate-binding protein
MVDRYRTTTRRGLLATTASIGLATTAGCIGGGSGGENGWYTPDGDRFRIRIAAPSNGTWPLNAETATQTLSDFGIDATAELKDKAAYGETIQQSAFEMAVQVWGASGKSRHPHNFLGTEYSENRSRVVSVDATAVEVPMPVGDPDGTVETVDVSARIEALGKASDEAEQSRLIEELAWIYNQHLPRLPLINGVNRVWLTTDEWDVPNKNSRWMRENPAAVLLTLGRIKQAGEDTTYTIPTRRANPTDMQWNPYFAQKGQTTPDQLMFEPLLFGGPYPNDVDASDHPDYIPMLASGIEVGDGAITVTINDDRVWTDGDPVTAADVATQYRLEKHLGQRTGGLWDSLEQAGEHELVFDIGDRNPDTVIPGVLYQRIRTKRDSQFADWVDRFENANEDERSSLREEIVTTRIDEPVSYALWKLDELSDSRAMLTRHTEHPFADRIGYDTVEMPAIGNNNQRWQSLAEDRLDGLFGSTAPRDIEDGFPAHAMRLPYDSLLGDAILFNHGQAPFDDRRVRQAVAFVINRWQNSHNAKDFVNTIEYPIGLPNREAAEYLGDSLQQYERYGYRESKPERAAELLRAAGYTRE